MPNIVIAGGGIGGGALATVLAREGIAIVVLERETVYLPIGRVASGSRPVA